jgi:hypothetical protein
MNKQAAKLAKTTALLNSTSIQLRISGQRLHHQRLAQAA